MFSLLKQFYYDEAGATAIEYGLIAALIGVAIIAGVSSVGTKLGGAFNSVSNNLSSS